MCGIVAMFNPWRSDIQRKNVETALELIKYRGPDDRGVYIDGFVGIGHVRLSIQDLSSRAAQPMQSHDGNHVIAYNGEIYNVKELQTDLAGLGVEIKSSGDTEALLEYCACFGIERTLQKIQGMFAFVLWDRKNRRLIAARDRHGIKPLYYRRRRDGRIDFASELKVLAFPDFEPDMTTLNATLMGLGATWGEPTVFKDVFHVRAGEYVVFDTEGREIRKTFFNIVDFIDQNVHRRLESCSTSEVVDIVHEELRQSTESQLLSDAPVAAFVSGGVDSSLIASMAKQKYRNLRLYHCNVSSESETAAAEDLARSLKLDLHVVPANDQDILANTAVATYHYESPLHYHNGSCVPFYLLSRKAGKDGIKVVLTGEGSDEYFLGYPNIAVRPYINEIKKIANNVQRLFHRIPRAADFLWEKRETLLSEQLKNMMFRYELQQRCSDAESRMSFIRDRRELDFRMLCIDMVIGNVSTLLQRNDRLGMAGGLESRFPFLGENIASLAVNLPSRYKIRKTMSVSDWRHAFISDKWIIRKIAGKYLPHSLSERRKYGFQSSVYRRLDVLPGFYDNGFIQNYYGLDKSSMHRLLDSAPPKWKESIFSLEVWGLVFPMRLSFDRIQEKIRSNTSITGCPSS